MKRLLSLFVFAIAISIAAHAQTPFTVNDLIAMKRVSDPQLSPDGKRIAFTIGIVDKAANRTINQIYVMSADGSNQQQITKATGSSSSPRWSPNGKLIAYVHAGQIWTMEPDGDGREQITKLSTGGGQPVWSPDGKWIAFSSDVYPECTTDECNKLESEKAENSKVKAHVTDRLLFRHWTDWRERLRTHVFVVSANGGPARDVTPGDFDSPPYGAATGTDYTFSPDSSSIVYLRNPDRVEATSTKR